MKRFVLLLFGYTGLCMTLASCIYFLLEKVVFRINGEHGYVFGMLYRMFLYHYQHPYQYIAIVSLVYGVVATLWALCCGTQTGWKLRWEVIALSVPYNIIGIVVGYWAAGFLEEKVRVSG
jgi:hypothetical protein